MKARTLKHERPWKDIDTIAYEGFDSMAEFRAVVSRRDPGRNIDYYAYLSNDYARPFVADWAGFSEPEDLLRRLAVGRPDMGIGKAAKTAAAKVRCDACAAPQERRAVVGECVDMAAYYMGIPECMIAIDEDESMPPVIRIILDTGIPGSVDVRDIRAAGTAFAAVVLALEERGFRVAIDTFNIGIEEEHMAAMSVPIKLADRPLGVAHLAFALADPAWHRGVVFAYRATCPEFAACYSMGCSARVHYTYMVEYADVVHDLMGDGTVFTMLDWAERAEALREGGTAAEDIPVMLAEAVIAEVLRGPDRAL